VGQKCFTDRKKVRKPVGAFNRPTSGAKKKETLFNWLKFTPTHPEKTEETKTLSEKKTLMVRRSSILQKGEEGV